MLLSEEDLLVPRTIASELGLNGFAIRISVHLHVDPESNVHW